MSNIDSRNWQVCWFLGLITFKMRKKRYQSLDKHMKEACRKLVSLRHFFIESEQKYLKFRTKST